MSQDRPSHDLATSGVSSNQAATGAAEQTSLPSGTPSSEGQAKSSESQGMPSAAREIPLPGHVTLPAEVQREHDAAVAEIRRAYQAIPPGARIRLAKRTSNLFRFRDPAPAAAQASTATDPAPAAAHIPTASDHTPGPAGQATTATDPAPAAAHIPTATDHTPGPAGPTATGHKPGPAGQASTATGHAPSHTPAPSGALDASAFAHVLHVDPDARIAVVGGLTTYEHLVDATLPHGLMPLVVPQLKTITLGGAVTGLGIESTSLRSGMPHESVLSMEILTGDGRVVTAAPGNEHADLYRGFPNSYGTLGYALTLTIELEPVRPYVHLRHFRFNDPAACMEAIAQIAEHGDYHGHRADFVDGTAFSLDELYLTVGAFSDVAPWLSDYTGQDIYYKSLRGPQEDFLTIRDYLWRWDTDWFWCSRPFGVQNPLVRKLWPRKYRRSDVYRKLVAFERRHGLTDVLNARRGAPPREAVIQDVEINVKRGADFLRFFDANVGMSPVWLCPLRLRSDRTWPLYPLAPGEVYVNFGFWGTVPLPPGRENGYHNRLVEDEVSALGGNKGLYSTSFYTEDQFWANYNGPAYAALKGEYDADGRLAGLYEKCVRGR